MADCCNEFSRSSLLRRAVSEAGSGLPAIEPGMPLPAGTGLDRRSFIARSVVLFPAPFAPTRVTICPSSTSIVTPFSAWIAP